MHGLRCIIASLKAHAHRCGIRLQAARLEDFKHLRNARLVADRRERIILRAPRLGRVFAGLAVDFVKLLGLRVIILPIAILDRPLGRHAVAMAERFKILFAQPEQRRAVNLRVAADVIGKAGPDFAAVLVEHHLGRIILERAVIIPIVLLTRQERPAFQHEDALAAGGEPMQQRPPPAPVPMMMTSKCSFMTGVGRGAEGNLTSGEIASLAKPNAFIQTRQASYATDTYIWRTQLSNSH